MADKQRFLRLESIVAYMQTEMDGDEIFIRYNGEKVAPQHGKFVRMTREPAILDVDIPVNSEGDQWVELELWDYDHLSPNDNLGKFRLLVDEVAEGFSAELAPEKDAIARYVLNWSVVER